MTSRPSLPSSLLIFVLFVLALEGFACSQEQTAGPPPQCCAANHTWCVTGALYQCNAEGTDLSVTLCPSGVCSGATCAERQCPGAIGSARCDASDPDARTRMVCSSAGTEVAKACLEGQRCVDGVCLGLPCVAGTKACGETHVYVCADGESFQQVQQCRDNEICDPAGHNCIKRACTPGERNCQGSRVEVCAGDGRRTNDWPCLPNESCRDGACVPTICGGGGADSGDSSPAPVQDAGQADALGDGASGSDLSSVPDELTLRDIPTSRPDTMKPPTKAEATIGGERVIFTSDKTATWVGIQDPDGDPAHALQISMVRGIQKLEILISGLQEEQVSLAPWTHEDQSVVRAEIRWSDGAVQIPAGQQGCTTSGWTSCANTYSLELQAFGKVGGLVRGTFEGTLHDGTAVEHGSFDVERLQ